jgi:uncharacterized damage-inducible protein DinB
MEKTMTGEQAKVVAESMLKMWEFEFPATCKVLAAVKEDNRGYKPDEKSRSAWEVASHLAAADIWFLQSVIDGKFAWDPEAEKKAVAQFKNVNDIVSFYKNTFPATVAEVRALSGERLAADNNFFGMLTWPNVDFIAFGNNHSVHHRGQLAAYLRAMGSKVPAIYGGSADEPMQG